LKPKWIVGYPDQMKRITSTVALFGLLAVVACKHKDNAPPPAASVAPLASAGALPVPGALPVFADFEGEIGLLAKGKFSDNDAPLQLALKIKAGKLRIDLPESLTNSRGLGPVYLLLQPTEKKAYAISEARKQAIVFELDKLVEQAKALGTRGGGQPTTPEKSGSLEKTGKFDTVAGIKCQIWHFTQGKNTGDACIAEQEAPWLNLPSAAASDLSWLTPIADGKHFPLRVVMTDQNVEHGRFEVTRIQHESLAPTLFDVPAGYSMLSLEQMMGAMLGGFGGTPPGLNPSPAIKPVHGAKPAAVHKPVRK